MKLITRTKKCNQRKTKQLAIRTMETRVSGKAPKWDIQPKAQGCCGTKINQMWLVSVLESKLKRLRAFLDLLEDYGYSDSRTKAQIKAASKQLNAILSLD